MSVQSFNGDLKLFSKKTGVSAEVAVRKIALEIFDGVTAKTPVDTGRAKGNWNLSIGGMDSSIDDSATSTEQGIPAKAPRVSFTGGIKPIYITNSLPYIYALEHGHSKTKAPKGMLSVTLNEIKASLL